MSKSMALETTLIPVWSRGVEEAWPTGVFFRVFHLFFGLICISSCKSRSGTSKRPLYEGLVCLERVFHMVQEAGMATSIITHQIRLNNLIKFRHNTLEHIQWDYWIRLQGNPLMRFTLHYLEFSPGALHCSPSGHKRQFRLQPKATVGFHYILWIFLLMKDVR